MSAWKDRNESRNQLLSAGIGMHVTEIHKILEGVGTYFHCVGSPMHTSMSKEECKKLAEEIGKIGRLKNPDVSNEDPLELPFPARMVSINLSDAHGVGAGDCFIKMVKVIEDFYSGRVTHERAMEQIGEQLHRFKPLMEAVRERRQL